MISNFQLKTPVAFFIFSRPDNTKKVFETIRQAKPPKLFVIADGPRADREGEAEKCDVTRSIINSVDWDCEVLKNYSDVNMGMKLRQASGFNWVFDNVEEAIFLEDDTLPHPSFFRYCEELLDYYRDDQRIMTISGNNFQFGRKRTDYSYYFSRYQNTWGWASWRRAWKYYDIEMKLWPKIREMNFLRDFLVDPETVKVWNWVFDSTYNEEISTWDFQWTLTCWLQSGLNITPNVNLISNLGFGPEATYTKNADSQLANIPMEAIELPLQHPPFVIRNAQADKFTQKTLHNYLGRLEKIQAKIEKFLDILS
jgi:hypothetical protein